MTAGGTLYLVSACGSAEEFVAAFRRYADRTGLFIPTAAPLPAGRRGRIALTLKDGGVMIEGEAEIVQSSAKPTVLYGRPGMTIKFVTPDDPSKTVIGELEKARLAMKPAPPSVPPRPTQIPAEPRPVVPALGGRIDAANALAECVVIGDPASLRDLSSPKSVVDAASSKKFTVPEIPGAPGRSKTPSIPPEVIAGRPRTPSTPPDLSGRPRTPSTPPDPASKPVPVPTNVPPSKPLPSSKLTSIGFAIVDKVPAAAATTASAPLTPAPPVTPPAAKPAGAGKMGNPENPLLKTTPGTAAPLNPTRTMPSQTPDVDEEATTIGEAPKAVAPAVDPASEPTDLASPPPVVAALAASKSGPTPAPPAPSTSGPSPAAPAAASGLLAPPPPPAPSPAPEPVRAPAAPLPSVASSASAKQKATSIGFPAVRTPFETQPLGVVPPAKPEPVAPVVPTIIAKPSADRSGGTPPPRGKGPTKPPPGPRAPTPFAPLPVVRSPAKSAPVVEDETTDITSEVPEGRPAAPSAPETVVAAAAYNDAAKAADNAVQEPMRTGGMRASEILRAIPTADWTMTPDASKPTVMPHRGWTPSGSHPIPKPETAESEHTPAPGEPPKPRLTGDWTISLDPEAPEAGWSEPSKVEKPPPPRRARTAGGNPDMAVASDKPIQAVEWEDKPTGIGEAKIEIDPTLMPADDDPSGPATATSSAPGFDVDGPSPFAAPPPKPDDEEAVPAPAPVTPSGRAGTEPFAGTPSGAMMRQPSAPAPLVGMRPLTGGLPLAPPPEPGGAFDAGGSLSGVPAFAPVPTNSGQPLLDGNARPQTFGYSSGSVETTTRKKSRKRTMLVVAASVAALAAGFALVLLVVDHNKKPAQSPQLAPPRVADAGVVLETPSADEPGSAAAGSDGSGSAEAAVVVEAPGDKPAEKPDETPADTAADKPPSGSCTVAVSSLPTGADIFIGKKPVGTTPADVEVTCGVATTLTLKKAKFAATDRDVNAKAGKPSSVLVKLAKPTVTLKVTSVPTGATITVGGKSMGVTPAKISLPAGEAASIVLSKPGYSSDTTKLVPKTNNTAHHVALKKSGKR